MPSYYEYSITGNLGGKYDPGVLYDTIQNNQGISIICIGYKEVSGNVEIHFNSSLSAPEKTVLDDIIDNYSYVSTLCKNNYIACYPTQPMISTEDYQLCGSMVFPGSGTLAEICEIEIVSKVDPGSTSYDIQIVDRDTNTIIAEQNFTNNDYVRQIFTTILFNPINLSTIEVSAKVNKTGNATKNVYVQQVLFWV